MFQLHRQLQVLEKSVDVIIGVDFNNFCDVIRPQFVARDDVIADVEDVGNGEEEQDVDRHQEGENDGQSVEGQRGEHFRPAMLVYGENRLAQLVESVDELGPTGRDRVAKFLECEPKCESTIQFDLGPFLKELKKF